MNLTQQAITWRQALIILGAIGVLVLVVEGYTNPAWGWVGIGNPSPKLLWDWLSALSIPTALGGVIVGFLFSQNNAQQDGMESTYKQNIGNLYLSAFPEAQNEERKRQARALTASVLPSLNARHQGEVLAYLQMPYRILCNGTFQKSQEARSGLGLASPHRTSLHNNRYGVRTTKTRGV